MCICIAHDCHSVHAWVATLPSEEAGCRDGRLEGGCMPGWTFRPYRVSNSLFKTMFYNVRLNGCITLKMDIT